MKELIMQTNRLDSSYVLAKIEIKCTKNWASEMSALTATRRVAQAERRESNSRKPLDPKWLTAMRDLYERMSKEALGGTISRFAAHLGLNSTYIDPTRSKNYNGTTGSIRPSKAKHAVAALVVKDQNDAFVQALQDRYNVAQEKVEGMRAQLVKEETLLQSYGVVLEIEKEKLNVAI
jgi:hypothetical protein